MRRTETCITIDAEVLQRWQLQMQLLSAGNPGRRGIFITLLPAYGCDKLWVPSQYDVIDVSIDEVPALLVASV